MKSRVYRVNYTRVHKTRTIVTDSWLYQTRGVTTKDCTMTLKIEFGVTPDEEQTIKVVCNIKLSSYSSNQ